MSRRVVSERTRFSSAQSTSRRTARSKRMMVSNPRAHLRRFPESVVVIEEYDKLPCEVRSVLRQLFDSGEGDATTASARKKKKGKKAAACLDCGGETKKRKT